VKGFVPTPPHLVDAMVRKLFRNRVPQSGDTLLDPGCGTGAFIEGVLRWCRRHKHPVPGITGIESNPKLLAETRRQLGASDHVQLLEQDFLIARRKQFDYIVGNPPYVPITGLSMDERAAYRRRFRTAVGRFDLYLLFFEQALKLLKPGGRLVFITPEKFLYVQTAEPLRQALADAGVEEIELIEESAFGELVTYPTITTVSRSSHSLPTRVTLRDGTTRTVRLGTTRSWLPLINGKCPARSARTLADAFVRISCGVATGADAVFVTKDADLPRALRQFAFRTLSGRGLIPGMELSTTHSMLVPYDRSGVLLPEADLGPLGNYLREPTRYARLMQRTCVARKPWYAFHENPPLPEILRPKILCKDIGAQPWFAVDERGDIVPRHSVYYLVPMQPERIHELCAYLNSAGAVKWLMAHCQRAANGFVRLQSHVLKQMPLPKRFVTREQLAWV
jgi:adenine-specific DNA-methyltransferase